MVNYNLFFEHDNAKEPTHPQTKSLPWIHTCKTGQHKNFQYCCAGEQYHRL